MYKQELLKRKQELENLIMKLEDATKSKQEGRLRIMVDDKKVKYFHIIERNDTKGTYIKKKDLELAVKLARADYNERLLKEARAELKTIEQFLNSYNPDNLGKIYANMHPERQKLLMPIAVTDEEYVRRWQSMPYESNPFRREDLKYETIRGDMVRTKSEAMIANLYYELGIPYKYEYPVKVKSGAVKYPDFVILNVCSREEIYHEHMGLFEDDEYRANNLKKLREYEKAGIILGKNLIISYETSYCPFDINQIRRMVQAVIRHSDNVLD